MHVHHGEYVSLHGNEWLTHDNMHSRNIMDGLDIQGNKLQASYFFLFFGITE